MKFPGPTEHELNARLAKALRTRYPGAWVHKVNERIQGGIPDIEFILNGVVLKIECKGRVTPVTDLQQTTHTKLARAGQNVLLLRFTGTMYHEHRLEQWAAHGVYEPLTVDLLNYIEVKCRR